MPYYRVGEIPEGSAAYFHDLYNEGAKGRYLYEDGDNIFRYSDFTPEEEAANRMTAAERLEAERHRLARTYTGGGLGGILQGLANQNNQSEYGAENPWQFQHVGEWLVKNGYVTPQQLMSDHAYLSEMERMRKEADQSAGRFRDLGIAGSLMLGGAGYLTGAFAGAGTGAIEATAPFGGFDAGALSGLDVATSGLSGMPGAVPMGPEALAEMGLFETAPGVWELPSLQTATTATTAATGIDDLLGDAGEDVLQDVDINDVIRDDFPDGPYKPDLPDPDFEWPEFPEMPEWELPEWELPDLTSWGEGLFDGLGDILGGLKDWLPKPDTGIDWAARTAAAAPIIAGIAYAKNQDPFDTSRLNKAYNEFNPGTMAYEFDQNTARGRDSLMSSLTKRNVMGSSFGNMDMTNFQTARDLGRRSLVDRGVLAQADIADKIINADAKSRALKNQLYGQSLLALGNVFGGKK